MPWEQNIHAGNRALSSGLFDQAYQRFKEAINEAKSFASGDPLWADAHRGLCRAAIYLSRLDEAEAAIKIAIETDEMFWGNQYATVAEDYYLAGEINRKLKNFESAKSYYNQALAFWSAQEGDRNEQALQSLSALVLLYLEAGYESGLHELHSRCFKAYQANYPTGMWMRFLRLKETLDEYLEAKELEKASLILNREVALMSATLGRNHKELKEILAYQSKILHDAKRFMAAWHLNNRVEKAQSEGLFFSDKRSYAVAAEQAITILSNLLSFRGNFLPANMPPILKKSWWQIIKSDPLKHELLAKLELAAHGAGACSGSFAEPEKTQACLELRARSQFTGNSTEVTFEWRLLNSPLNMAVKDLIHYSLNEFDQTFLILPDRINRRQSKLQAGKEGSHNNWPSPQNYNESVQNADSSFRDPELRAATPELNAIGLPRPLSGAFATVYKLSSANRQWAVKCFTEPVKDHQERYAEISKTLLNLKLPFFTEFSYLSDGIEVQGCSYPVLKMAWVEGQNLNAALESQLQNREFFAWILPAFVELVKSLERHGIAHGDLQHGNILVNKAGLVLVDYDCMFVPGLAGRQSNEIGHRNYQHPARSATHFGAYMDNFSIWVVYFSLSILSVYPELWETLECGEESLLFESKDFTSPEKSRAFEVLGKHEDSRLREAAASLLNFLQMDPASVPSPSKYFASRKALD